MAEYKYNGYLEARLQLWAWWYISIARGEVGWPPASIMTVVLELGAYIHSPKPRDIPTNDLAEEINMWVIQLGKLHPQLEKALRAYYGLDEESIKLNRQLPLKRIAQKQGISLSNFKERVKDAKLWLSGRIYPETEKFHDKLGIV